MFQNFTDEEIEDLVDIGWLTASDGSHRRIQVASVSHERQYALCGIGYNRYYKRLSALLDKEGIAYDDLRWSWIYRGTLYNSPAFLDKLTHDRLCPCSRCIPTDFVTWCQAVVSSPDWVIIDTETTDKLGEIIDLAIIDSRGGVLYNSLLNPATPIPEGAEAVHHITRSMTDRAPKISEEWSRICDLVEDRRVITYNTEFDRKRIDQSLHIHRVTKCGDCEWRYECAMRRYAAFWNAPPKWRGANAPWQALETACAQQGIALNPSLFHRALADAQATLQLIRQVALAGENARRYKET